MPSLKIAGKIREVEIRDDGCVPYRTRDDVSAETNFYFDGAEMLQTSFKVDGEIIGVAWTSARLAELAGDRDIFRNEEDMGYFEGMLQTLGASDDEIAEARAAFRDGR